MRSDRQILEPALRAVFVIGVVVLCGLLWVGLECYFGMRGHGDHLEDHDARLHAIETRLELLQKPEAFPGE